MFYQELLNLLKAREPGIWITTSEEKEVIVSIKNAVDTVGEYESVYTFSISEGINELIVEDNKIKYKEFKGTNNVIALNEMIKESNDTSLRKSRVWILKDFHLLLNNPNVIRIIRDLKESPIARYTPIIIISPSSEVPLELQKTFKVMHYETPNVENIEDLIKLWCAKKNIKISKNEMPKIAKRLFGFTRSEIIKMLNLSLVKYGTINLDIINEKKIENINESGVLDYKIPKASLDNVGGNVKFKEWVTTMEICMSEEAREYGIPAPKGYLSVGIPGTSKSFSAEAIAGKWNVPFIKLNMAKITSRYAGETERNMHKALNLVRSCAPCVLLIDEVEKALGGYKSSNASDSGAIARAFGNVLEFLNDNDNGVFVVMTSNDVSQLPPELTRAGRLDAIWFFGLPSTKERESILQIHLDKTGKAVNKDVVQKIAKEMNNFTGAEIELVVKSALRKSFLNKVKKGEDEGITYDILKEATAEVIPVAISSREQVISLERWAKNRALIANDSDEKETLKPTYPRVLGKKG